MLRYIIDQIWRVFKVCPPTTHTHTEHGRLASGGMAAPPGAFQRLFCGSSPANFKCSGPFVFLCQSQKPSALKQRPVRPATLPRVSRRSRRCDADQLPFHLFHVCPALWRRPGRFRGKPRTNEAKIWVKITSSTCVSVLMMGQIWDIFSSIVINQGFFLIVLLLQVYLECHKHSPVDF